jgi:hypothetical protein
VIATMEADKAIATARSGLTDIRERFETGTLDRHERLLVRYALPGESAGDGDGSTEYRWAYVTSWRDPFRILATMRSGRSIVVDTAAVVDWAVEHDERGIIEGAWTQAANGSA